MSTATTIILGALVGSLICIYLILNNPNNVEPWVVDETKKCTVYQFQDGTTYKACERKVASE